MENDPVTLIVALDDDFKASGQVYFDDGITHDWQNKNEFILGNLSVTKGQINYRYDIHAFSNYLCFSLDSTSGSFNAPTWVEKVEIYGLQKVPALLEVSSNGWLLIMLSYAKYVLGQTWKPLASKLVGNTLVIRKPDVKVNSNFSIRFG